MGYDNECGGLLCPPLSFWGGSSMFVLLTEPNRGPVFFNFARVTRFMPTNGITGQARVEIDDNHFVVKESVEQICGALGVEYKRERST